MRSAETLRPLMPRIPLAPVAILALFAPICLLASVSVAQTNATPHTGFPQFRAGGGESRVSKVLVVDLDNNNGPQEIVVGTNYGTLYVFNHDGSTRGGWPQTLPSYIASSPAAGQLDADQALEIVVACGHDIDGEREGRVVAYDTNGILKWDFRGMQDATHLDGLPDAVFSTPALGDLDGDGFDDVTFAAFDFYVYALKGTNGTVLPSRWPVWIRESIWSSPALADLDGNGTLEVIIGSDTQAEGVPINTPLGGGLWVFRGDGSQFPNFPRFVTYAPGETAVGIMSSPVVGDVTGDGCPEIIVGTGLPVIGAGNTVGRKLHAWSWDGSIPPGWPLSLPGHADGSPALANLDGDAALEVVVGSTEFNDPNPRKGWLNAFNGDGTQIFQVRPKTSTGASADGIGEPIIAQVGSDSPAVLASYVGWQVAILSAAGVQRTDDGTHAPGSLVYGTVGPSFGTAVADLDDDGDLVLVQAAGGFTSNAYDPAKLGVFAWELGSVGALPWPMYRQNPRRTGTAPGTTGCAVPNPNLGLVPVTPCRVADSRQAGNLTYGGPPYAAGEERNITFTAGTCAIPATARAVAVNVTVTGPTNSGRIQVYPAGDGRRAPSVTSFSTGQTRASFAIIPLSFDGRGNLGVYADMPSGQVNVIVDITGYFRP